MWRIGVVVAAAGAALAPLPPAAVERLYSAAIYPPLQRMITGLSNQSSIAVFDVLIGVTIAGWAALVVRDIAARRGGWVRVIARSVVRAATVGAVLYLAFLAIWGLNYRRVPLTQKLEFDASAVSSEAARKLAAGAVAEINRLYASADRAAAFQVDLSLAAAFERAQSALGVTPTARPARPKRSLLDLYFRRAAVDGMTDPYFLETLVVSNLLPFERSFVVAHEWSHLAGFADEGEANFLGWLTCLRGSPPVQYSGWLYLYREVTGSLSPRDRRAVSEALAPGPRDDLRAIDQRIREHISPRLSALGWQVYDRYLKANRVESGTASYAEVVRLILGTQFSSSWTPAMRGNRVQM